MKIALLPLLALAAASPALGATRNYTVTDFDKVRIEGAYKVSIATNRSPFARAEGDPVALDSVIVEVQGRTLVVRPNRGAWGGYPGRVSGPVIVTAGAHDLTNVLLSGAGALDVDHIRGLSFNAAAQGAGTLTISDLRADRVSISLAGAASARVAGTALALTGIVRGSGMLDAEGLAAKDITLGLEGPSEIRAAASNTAQVSANGPGRITLSGKPACTIKGATVATIAGCR